MDFSEVLPIATPGCDTCVHRPVSRFRSQRVLLAIVLLLAGLQASHVIFSHVQGHGNSAVYVPLHAEDILARCRLLEVPLGPPPNFHARQRSDRFVPGTRPTLIKVRAILAQLTRQFILIAINRTRPSGQEKQTGSKLSVETCSSMVASSSKSSRSTLI